MGETDARPAARGVPARATRLARWCLYLVAALVPLLTTSRIGVFPLTHDVSELPKVAVVRVLAVAAIALWAIAAAGAGSRVRWHPAMWLVIGWISWSAVATALSQAPIMSFVGAHGRLGGLSTQLIYPLLAFTGMQLLGSERALRAFARAASTGVLPIAVFALAQHLSLDPFTYLIDPAFEMGAGRAFATMANPVFLGGYLVVALPLAVATGVSDTDVRWRALGLACAALGPAALMATYTRSAWVAIGVQVVVVLLAVRPRVSEGAVRQGWVAAGVGVVAAGVLAVRSASVLSGLAERVVTSFDAVGGSVGERLLIWRGVSDAVLARPIFGWGPDRLSAAFEAYRPAEHAARYAMFGADNAHDWPLELAATIGVPGAALALGSWAWALVTSAPAALGARRGSPVLTAAWIAVAGYAVHLAFSVAVVASHAIAWVLVGALLAAGSARLVEVPTRAVRTAGWSALIVAGALVLSGTYLMRADANYLEYRARFNAAHSGDPVEPARVAMALSPLDQTYASGLGLAYLSRVETLTAGNDRVSATEAARRAQSAYEHALRIEPADWFSWLELARARGALGDTPGAREALERAKQVAPRNPLVRFRADGE